MIALKIPGFGELNLDYLLLDLNGTLTCDGELLPGVAERIGPLKQRLEVRLLTADTRGTATGLATTLGLAVERVTAGGEAAAKQQAVTHLGGQRVAAIGNGANDAEMLAAAALGIVVLGREGTSTKALVASDIVVASIIDALDLLLDETRLLATLRR